MGKIKATSFILIVCIAICLTHTSVFGADAVSVSEVYIGGFPVSIELLSDGPIVRSVSDDCITSGELKAGDVIKSVNGIKVGSRSDIVRLYNSDDITVPIRLTVLRDNVLTEVETVPDRDICSGKPKLGFQTKDGISGLGTVTCYTKSGSFYALGHPISDADCTSKFTCRAGSVYKCDICGYQKPTTGKAGRLIGRCSESSPYAAITENSDFGLRGNLSDAAVGEVYATMPRSEVKPGKAQIFTTIGTESAFYDIEIVKAVKQGEAKEKGMIIRVTDENLLRATGGILQGMSGSPILQNGCIAGALTHVLTNNPTRGYGVYIDWILS